ncbi:Alpha-ketoglutarate-dependent dioxygenase AlkB-like [Dillenia turbinata]|uniref:Alpha-ketoglutarate-dependent dioxygenase AlkB-like n=1 Tax=Dillenia turbinata TaxID=194707 RepID=A0AAN8VR03_9MAGN
MGRAACLSCRLSSPNQVFSWLAKLKSKIKSVKPQNPRIFSEPENHPIPSGPLRFDILVLSLKSGQAITICLSGAQSIIMGVPRFVRPKGRKNESTPSLYVANCGPAVGISFDTIAMVFGSFGEVKGVYPADETGARVIVSYFDQCSAQRALEALDGHLCPDLQGRRLHLRYSATQEPCQVNNSFPVSLLATELGIPGIQLWLDFLSPKEEQELLAAVECRPWKTLSKRRVQHYGYEFHYETRNINPRDHLGELPPFVMPMVRRIASISNLDIASTSLDQLTVNEYPPGVGLSPHIDTHSAFEGFIFSLSLAGPCIMEFRKYTNAVWLPKAASSINANTECSEGCSSFVRKAIYLPPRSLLILSGEGRYAWHHYIPHHKVDIVNGNEIRRGSRRVSFTFRKARTIPCKCDYPQYCDSQR